MSQPVLKPASGKLAILTPGMGAVATTLYAGVAAARLGRSLPVGSFTQLGRMSADDARAPKVKDALPLAGLDQLVFGGWDPIGDDAYTAAKKARVLSSEDLAWARPHLEGIRPMTAVFEQRWVRRLEGAKHVKTGTNLYDLATQLREDIRAFCIANGCDRAVMVWCGSTEAYRPAGEVHQSLRAFEEGMRNNHPDISPSQLYAWAALQERVPFANGSPNVCAETPALQELARELCVPVCGKDFKTGQTLLKTALAPTFKARNLGIKGWFSTNILGNRDGEVLDDPDSFRSKEVTKTGVLESILDPAANPELYGDLHHLVRINYYPPKGDDKEGWDHIDLFGWMGYPMQVKVDFLCKDSILAAPLVLDLALLLDLAARARQRGAQEWLGYFFKNPMAQGREENDLFVQYQRLLAALSGFAAQR